jgi:hypothetical protein
MYSGHLDAYQINLGLSTQGLERILRLHYIGYMDKKSLYIETTIPSYATSRIESEKKLKTNAFFDHDGKKFDMVTSIYTFNECRGGNPEAAERRLAFLKNMPSFQESDEIISLAAFYQNYLQIPDRAKLDCSHLAVCVINRVDFLLTWNFTHLGPASQEKMKEYNEIHGLWSPILVTPETIYSFINQEGL